MSRPRVRLGIPPHLADLELWGRDVSGEWWALVVWSVQVTPPDGTHPVPVGCAAWVPGVQLEQPLQPVEYLQVRRMQLPAESAEWPAPVDRPGAHWRGYYLGILDGAEPQLPAEAGRAEEHTSELQSRRDLVCRLLLEKKKHRPGRLDALADEEGVDVL